MNSTLSLLGLACGDAFGSSLEGWNPREECNIGTGFMGHCTDDTVMAYTLLKHYKRYKSVVNNAMLADYKAALGGVGTGRTITNAIFRGFKDPKSESNGALMRQIPFAVEVWEKTQDITSVQVMLFADCQITHSNAVVEAASYLGFLLAKDGIEALEQCPLSKKIEKASGDTGWVIDTLKVVSDTMKKNVGFMEGFKYICGRGGDMDTNCAIYGAILGANHDIRDEIRVSTLLPRHWLGKIEDL